MTHWQERNWCLEVVDVIFIASMDIKYAAETYDMKRKTCFPSITCCKVWAHSTSAQLQTNTMLQECYFCFLRTLGIECMCGACCSFLIKHVQSGHINVHMK